MGKKRPNGTKINSGKNRKHQRIASSKPAKSLKGRPSRSLFGCRLNDYEQERLRMMEQEDDSPYPDGYLGEEGVGN
ncbi:MAG: hypothetical protein WDN47_01305 [Candidatus Doudnabacteria bacterium]